MPSVMQQALEAAAAVVAWNERCPPGTPVLFLSDVGRRTPTRTRSTAFVSCGSPMVKVEGRVDGCALTRVVPNTHAANRSTLTTP